MEISLNCSILGPDVKCLFSVKVPHEAIVNVLKDAIKEKKTQDLTHIDAKKLDIWKASETCYTQPAITFTFNNIFLQLKTPFSEDAVGEQLKGVDDPAKIPGGAEKLRATRKLSSYFSGSPIGNIIHLVVQVPPSGEHQPISRVILMLISKSPLALFIPPLITNISPHTGFCLTYKPLLLVSTDKPLRPTDATRRSVNL